jgi:hypothetical protein
MNVVHEEGVESRRDIQLSAAWRCGPCVWGLLARPMLSSITDMWADHGGVSGGIQAGKAKTIIRQNTDLRQGICLEEMLGETIPNGALFYGRTDAVGCGLQRGTEAGNRRGGQAGHGLIASGKTPKPVYTKKCDLCSLLDLCTRRPFRKAIRVELSGKDDGGTVKKHLNTCSSPPRDLSV